MPPIVNQNMCTACGYCADICPVDGLKLFDENGAKSLIDVGEAVAVTGEYRKERRELHRKVDTSC